MQPHAQELFFNIFYTFVCKKIFFLPTKISREKLEKNIWKI